MNDGDEEYHQYCWLVRRHHQAAPVKVGLKQREGEGEKRKIEQTRKKGNMSEEEKKKTNRFLFFFVQNALLPWRSIEIQRCSTIKVISIEL